MTHYTLRDASRSPSFFNGKIDVKVAFPLLILMIAPSISNLIYCVLFIGFFVVLGFFGIKVPVFLKMISRKFRGKKVYARPWWLKAKWAVDAKNIERGKGIIF